jgi:hypothetical protein
MWKYIQQGPREDSSCSSSQGMLQGLWDLSFLQYRRVAVAYPMQPDQVFCCYFVSVLIFVYFAYVFRLISVSKLLATILYEVVCAMTATWPSHVIVVGLTIIKFRRVWREFSRYSDWLRAGRSGDRISVGANFSYPARPGVGLTVWHLDIARGKVAEAWRWPSTLTRRQDV